MTEDDQFSVSEPSSFSEHSVNYNSAIQKTKRKVQFSDPLEHWREFDKETGEMYELNDSKNTHEESMKQQLENTVTCDKDQDTDSGQEKLDCKGAAKTQSITEVIQAFQKRQYRRTDVSKQTQEKPRRDLDAVIKKNAKSSSSSLHTKQLKHSRLLCNMSTCSKLATDGEFLLNLRKEPSLIQSYCTYSFSSSMGMLTGFKVSPLPLVSTSRKLYDERLLPRTVVTSVERKYPSIRTAKYDSGLPPVGQLSTPHIVQLFD
ncbi:uncharacterized protein LOC110047195 [Orbicella faveolata]|uniref:uncharacterized protein LOC110047195 n=1 Tax=Orbicella faveolata TaxID=48498 RepID=UPI0009E3EA1B|nr:uncharacterized protein LOC110047195 [Orbicella faveolata]